MIVKKYKIVFFLIGYASLLIGDDKRHFFLTRKIFDTSFRKLEVDVSKKSFLINRENLLEYHIFFKKRAVVLCNVIKKVDAALQYWEREKHTEYRIPWYRKSVYRCVDQKKYRKKISKAISSLQALKKESCYLLGLLSAYSDEYQHGNQKEACATYHIIESHFAFSGVQDGLVLGRNLMNHCRLLTDELKKHDAPKHFHAYWKSYLTGAASLAVAAYVYSIHKDVFANRSKIVSDICKEWWQENITDNVEAAQNWRRTGMTGKPLKILKNNPDDENGFVYISEASQINANDIPPLRAVIDQDMYAVRFAKFASRGDSVHVETGAFANMYNDKVLPWLNATREQFMSACRETEDFINQRSKKHAGKILFAKSAEAILFGAGCLATIKFAYDYFYQKKLYMDPLRYHVAKLHQIVHATHESRYLRDGLLRAHLEMLLEVTCLLPTDVEQAVCEDVVDLKTVLVSIEEKQHIIDRWYKTYHFLQV